MSLRIKTDFSLSRLDRLIGVWRIMNLVSTLGLRRRFPIRLLNSLRTRPSIDLKKAFRLELL